MRVARHLRRRLREGSFRFVLIVGVLTTIATSAPQHFILADAATVSLQAQTVKHVTVRFSADANEPADELSVRLSGNVGSAMIIPDDPRIAPGTSLSIDALMVCPETGPCELGFSLDPGDELSASVDVEAQATRFADASFCFPDNREFKPTATVDVVED